MNAWMCDRCRKASTAGDVDDPPDGWRFLPLPVRGSGAARSTRDGVICSECDDSLYGWLISPRRA